MSSSIQLLRHHALQLFQTGIDAADPYLAVQKYLIVEEGGLTNTLGLDDEGEQRKASWSKICLVAFGKAACSMAKAAVEIIPKHYLVGKPIVVTNYENVIPIKYCEVIGAGHPYPDFSGQKAAQSIVERLKKSQADELVLVLISGGGSALVPYPVDSISLGDKIITNNLLLASGANIQQINCVRKHLSQIKGGWLAKLASPACCHALILSDVINDDLSTVASGPTVPDNTTFLEAISILKEKLIWDYIPINVKIFLEKGEQGNVEETPKTNNAIFKNTSHSLIGSNTISLNALIDNAKKLGYVVNIFSWELSGEAREVAEQLVLHAKKLIENGLTSPVAIVAGGETTVTIRGSGRGGRNQEMALAFSIAAERLSLMGEWTFLSGGTDGVDGPTDAAGGIVDSKTFSRIIEAELSPEDSLDNNDSYSTLIKTKDLVMIGATGTNVADLLVLLVQ
ncbi:MAG: glycerate kinase [Methylococcaceae bacterium]|nr:glycerate kinase [Methylococcaceae bacterium]